jgi:hypothetical protein
VLAAATDCKLGNVSNNTFKKMRLIKAEYIVIIILSIYAISSFLITPYTGLSFRIGIVGLIISIFLTYKFYKYSFYLLALLLALAIPNIVAFSQQRFYIGSGNVSINFIPTILLIYLCIKRRIIFSNSSAIDESEKNESRKRRVKIFKNEFQNLSNEEIQIRLQNNQLVEEAKIALNELLENKV